MAFAWTEVGRPPADDELEVVVFGPGFGESILVHLGNSHWIAIDSCVDSADEVDKRPVAEKYLRALGVDPGVAVRLIVASHWHDDHVRGLSRLVEICPSAAFSCSAALVRDEFATYVMQMSTASASTDGAKVREFTRVLELLANSGRQIHRAVGGRVLCRFEGQALRHGGGGEVMCLSPSDREFSLFLQQIAALLPQHGQGKIAAPPRQTPNLASVVLAVTVGPHVVSLGADMELHSDPLRGWSAVFDQASAMLLGRASAVKVAHHGSTNGHHADFWRRFIEHPACSVVTPFNRLSEASKLPTEHDLKRLMSLGRVFVAGPTSLRKPGARDPAVVRSLRESDIEFRDLRTGLGMVRLRRSIGADVGWRAETISPAREVTA